MFHRTLPLAGIFALAGAVVLFTAGTGFAQHRGGGGGRGFAGARGTSAGTGLGFAKYATTFSGSNFSRGFSTPGSFGGVRSTVPLSNRNFSNLGRTRFYNFYPYYGQSVNGSPYYSYNNGNYPTGSFYGYTGSYSDSYPGDAYSEVPLENSSNGYVPSGGLPLQYPPPSDSEPNPAAAPTATPADVTVNVPASAEVWFDGRKMTSTGSVRNYQTPPLSPNQRYSYNVKARWEENGREVVQNQVISFAPGNHTAVTFPSSSRNEAQAGTTIPKR
jgi:uncharacterized protein (TIGR03000 family)